MQARYYDPVTGRFLSIDPVQFSANMPFMFNRYAYVGGDPVNATDPDGEFINFVVGAAIGAVVEVGVQVIVEGKSITELDAGKVVASTAVGALTGGAAAFTRAAVAGSGKAIGAKVVEKGAKKAAAVQLTKAERVVAGASGVELAAGRGVLKEATDAKEEGRDFDSRKAVGKATVGVLTGNVGDQLVDQVVDGIDNTAEDKEETK